jgi:hypothetical protein
MPLEPEELIALAAEEMRQNNSTCLYFDLTSENAMAFLAMLQLVVRHPELPDSMADLARDIADMIECQLSACGPATRAICRAGWATDPDDGEMQ